MSGNAIREEVVNFYEASSVGDRLLILTWFIAGVATFSFIYFTIRGIRKKKTISKYNFIKGKLGKSRTDLDTLYEILKQKKTIDIIDIEKTFNVDSDVAFEWAKILENGNLAIIDYPRFRKPTLKLVEKEGMKNGVKERVVEKRIFERGGLKRKIVVAKGKVIVAKEKVVKKGVVAKEKVAMAKKKVVKKVVPQKKEVKVGVAQRIIAAQLEESEKQDVRAKKIVKKKIERESY
ncbi:hypothetical protein HNV12_02840 [Methanococcoides sp. SA1]|nr:hypothetical protein [Methanococcoides sp. SA1]